MNIPMVAPVFPAGKEPLPPGITDEERENYMQAKRYQNWMTMGMESCVAKTVIAGGGGECPHYYQWWYELIDQVASG